MSDGKIEVVGKDEILLSFGYESMVNRGIGMLSNIKKLLKKVFDKEYDIAIVTDAEWEKIKNKYIDDTKNKGIKYEYIVPTKQEKSNKQKIKNENITSQAIDLFGEDMISVN